MKKILLIAITILLLFATCGCSELPQEKEAMGNNGYFIIVKKLDNAHYAVEDLETKVKYIASRTKDYYYVIGCEYKDKR